MKRGMGWGVIVFIVGACACRPQSADGGEGAETGTTTTGSESSTADGSTSESESTDDEEETDTTGGPDSAELTLVGHHDLLGRGMNAALAIAGDHAYVGSRIDGVPHEDTGVLIVDIADPTDPQVVGQIGPPDEALLGMTSRELRTVPDLELLMVLNFACNPTIHGCSRDANQFPNTGGAAENPNLKFYDIADPTAPVLLATHDFGTGGSGTPHEFFLWRDPNDSDRILLFLSMPLGPPALRVLDVSDLQNITTISTWDPHVDGELEEPRGGDSLLHSVAVTDDGQIGFLSHIGSGLLLIDTSQITAGMASPQVSLLHDIADRVDYSPPALPGTHSAFPIPGRDLVVLTDEIYPAPLFDGCPWGWARIVDYAEVDAPAIVGEYALEQNDPEFCLDVGQDDVTFTAHNSTMTENLALITWHAGGFQVVDTSDPAAPVGLVEHVPEPLPAVLVEDPIMFKGGSLMWSYPIIKDGLIYVVDIRNGLYVYEYSGPFEDEIADRAFSEGNSNLD